MLQTAVAKKALYKPLNIAKRELKIPKQYIYNKRATTPNTGNTQGEEARGNGKQSRRVKRERSRARGKEAYTEGILKAASSTAKSTKL